MAAQITLQPHDDRGREILDELEQETGELPFRTNNATGSREYYLNAQDVDTSGFDPMLDRIDADWRDHISRTP